MTLTIRRVRIDDVTKFEIIEGPAPLVGLSLIFPAIKKLHELGFEVKDEDAERLIREWQSKWQ